jgi:hypothetical protein
LSAQLTSSGQSLVLSASPRPIEEAAASLTPYLKDKRWLGRNNRYLKETVQRLKEDLFGGGVLSPVQQKHLRELIAASAVTHCLDGWAMLGRAAGSTLLGDPHSTRHLAYYAELRAACSLLARSGIAVLSGQHLVVDARGTVIPVKGQSFVRGYGGTHVAAWAFLEEWSTTTDAADTTASILSPEGIALSEWFRGRPVWARWRLNASGWLKELGLDIRLLAGDQFARNEASYRPHTIRTDRIMLSACDNSRFVTELWGLAEPGTHPFARLDSSLFRVAIERAYRSAVGAGGDLRSNHQYLSDVQTLVDQQDLADSHRSRLVDYLVRRVAPEDPLVIKAALSRSKAINPAHHLHAMARATLMLRVATGASRQMLSNAGIEPRLLDFWWQQLAASRSISHASSPDELLDAWADITEAVDQIDTYISDTQGATFVELSHPSRCGALSALGKWELAGLLGIVG